MRRINAYRFSAAVGLATVLMTVVVTSCSDDPATPVTPVVKKNYQPPSAGEIARAAQYVRSRKPAGAVVPRGGDPESPAEDLSVRFSLEDGVGVANEVAALETDYNGEHLVINYRMDGAGANVDRVAVDVGDEQVYTMNLYWNADQLTEITQTAYEAEQPGQTRADYVDGEGWAQMDMRIPLGHLMLNGFNRSFNFSASRFVSSRQSTFSFPNCSTQGAVRGITYLATQAAQAKYNQGPPTIGDVPNVDDMRAMSSCLGDILRANATLTVYAYNALKSAGLGFAVNSWQNSRTIWDRLRRLIPRDGTDWENSVWYNKYAGECNATAGGRACTSLSAYLQM